MKLGSLFDGSGTCPLAASMVGILPVWASEIEPFPVAVTSSRFPGMKHLGDITKINGAEIEPVDVITFGSPCQNLSIAGNRKGLDGEESVLFLEAVRIIKEMRSATDGRYPQIAMWENVPGAFSSNGGATSKKSSKNSAKSANPTYQFLDLRSGAKSAPSWETRSASHGESWTLEVGEFPSVAVESSLSSILEDNVPLKYFSSERACVGILSRSEKSGKPLPELLANALKNNIAIMRWIATHKTAEFPWREITWYKPSQGTWEAGGEHPIHLHTCSAIKDYAPPQYRSDGVASTLATHKEPRNLVVQAAYDLYALDDIATTLKASGGNLGGGSENLIVQPPPVISTT